MLAHSTFNQKGKLYRKYEQYLNMYDYINLDDYPIFFKVNEIICSELNLKRIKKGD